MEKSTAFKFKEQWTVQIVQNNKKNKMTTWKTDTTSGVFLGILITVTIFNKEQSSTCRKKAHAQFRSKMLMSSVEQIAALDVLQDRQINDNRIVAGDRELLGPWTGFTQFEILNEPPPKGCTWSGET